MMMWLYSALGCTKLKQQVSLSNSPRMATAKRHVSQNEFEYQISL